MASRYGWPVALSLVAFATISTPAVPEPHVRRARSIAARPISTFATPSPPPRRGCAPRQRRAARRSSSANASIATAVRCGCSNRPASRSMPEASHRRSRRWLASESGRLGLTAADLGALVVVRDYTTRATGVRHLLFRQVVDGYPVFDSAIAIHVAANGRVLRVTSNAAAGRGPQSAVASLSAATAALAAAQHARRHAWSPGARRGCRSTARCASPGTSWSPQTRTSPTSCRRAVERTADPAQPRPRRQRRSAASSSRAATAAALRRQPDPMPLGGGGTPACPPPANYELRALDTPFRDPATVVASTGRLEGNNVAGLPRQPAARRRPARRPPTAGCSTSRSTRPASAETSLFFARELRPRLLLRPRLRRGGRQLPGGQLRPRRPRRRSGAR